MHGCRPLASAGCSTALHHTYALLLSIVYFGNISGSSVCILEIFLGVVLHRIHTAEDYLPWCTVCLLGRLGDRVCTTCL